VSVSACVLLTNKNIVTGKAASGCRVATISPSLSLFLSLTLCLSHVPPLTLVESDGQSGVGLQGGHSLEESEHAFQRSLAHLAQCVVKLATRQKGRRRTGIRMRRRREKEEE
jgi:hypothetical protein